MAKLICIDRQHIINMKNENMKMSPTDPSFSYELIQKDERNFLIIFIGWTENYQLLQIWFQEKIPETKLIPGGWEFLSEEHSSKLDDWFDEVYQISFERVEDVILFKLIWS